jgi:hypothetical protein
MTIHDPRHSRTHFATQALAQRLCAADMPPHPVSIRCKDKTRAAPDVVEGEREDLGDPLPALRLVQHPLVQVGRTVAEGRVFGEGREVAGQQLARGTLGVVHIIQLQHKRHKTKRREDM